MASLSFEATANELSSLMAPLVEATLAHDDYEERYMGMWSQLEAVERWGEAVGDSESAPAVVAIDCEMVIRVVVAIVPFRKCSLCLSLFRLTLRIDPNLGVHSHKRNGTCSSYHRWG